MARRYRGPYRLTPNRKRALRKAQLVSARKRKGKGLSRNKVIAATGVTAAVLAGGAAYGRHKLSGSVLIANAGSRTPTPMMNIAGERIPGTRAGLAVSAHGKGDFSYTYTSRNKSGDRTLFTYRHKPLRASRLRAYGRLIRGRRIGGSPASVTNFKPSSAEFTPKQEELFQWANRDALSSGAKRIRRNLMIQNDPAKKIRVAALEADTLRPISGGLVRKIGGDEAYRRTNKYLNALKKQGVAYDFNHVLEANRRFRDMER